LLGLVVLAVAPSLALFLFFYLRDRERKAPARTILFTFLLGAGALLPAALVSFCLEQLTGWRVGAPGLLQSFLGAMLVVGLVEESAKYIVVRFYCYHRREFDEPYDGILYSVIAALGFATVENIYYVLAHGAGTGVVRALIAVPNHAFDGVLMGFFLGLAKFASSDRRGNILSALGLVLAVVAHGFYDLIVFRVDSAPGLVLSLLLFAALTWLIFFEATHHHRSRSPYEQPGLADLHRNGFNGHAAPPQPAGDRLTAMAAHDRIRPPSRYGSAGATTANLDQGVVAETLEDVEPAPLPRFGDVENDVIRATGSLPDDEPPKPDRRPRA
jgi:RsiW-degrading membrane proteinase PrsW (M82 family)